MKQVKEFLEFDPLHQVFQKQKIINTRTKNSWQDWPLSNRLDVSDTIQKTQQRLPHIISSH